MYLLYGLLTFVFMYVATDFLVFIVFHLMDTIALIVINHDFSCYLVYRPQGCNKPEYYPCLFTEFVDKFPVIVIWL